MLSKSECAELYKFAKARAQEPFQISAVRGALRMRGVTAVNSVTGESSVYVFQPKLKSLEQMKLLAAWLDSLYEWWDNSLKAAGKLVEEM